MRFSLGKGALDNEIHKNISYNVCAMMIWSKKTPNLDCRVLLETEGSDAVLEKINLASSISHGRVTKEVQMRHTLPVCYLRAHQKSCKSCQQAILCAYISCPGCLCPACPLTVRTNLLLRPWQFTFPSNVQPQHRQVLRSRK